MALSLIGLYGMDRQSGLISYNVLLSMDLKDEIDLVNRARKFWKTCIQRLRIFYLNLGKY